MRVAPIYCLALLACLAGCVKKKSLDPLPPEPGAATHTLTWDKFQDADAREQINYFMDGMYLGPGESGMMTFREAVKKMPRGSSVLVYPLLDDTQGGGRLRLPFDIIEMSRYATSCGVFLAVSAGE